MIETNPTRMTELISYFDFSPRSFEDRDESYDHLEWSRETYFAKYRPPASSKNDQSTFLPSICDPPREIYFAKYRRPTEITEIKLPYVSTDESENIDNDDPEWEAMKKIQNDDDRYKMVRKRWKNFHVPDPNINLTSHMFRAMRIGIAPVRGKRKRLSDGSDQDAKKMRSCAEFFDEKIAELKRRLVDVKNEMNYDYYKRKMQLRFALRAEKLKILSRFWSRRKEKMADISRCCAEFIKDQRDLQEALEFVGNDDELDRIRDGNVDIVTRPLCSEIDKIRNAKNEVLVFNKYYSGLKNSSLSNVDRNLLDDERYNEIKEIEKIYMIYDHFYTISM